MHLPLLLLLLQPPPQTLHPLLLMLPAGPPTPPHTHTTTPTPPTPLTRTLVPCVRVTRVLPTLRTANMEGALMSYQSFLEKGSTIFFLPPFLPLLMRLFLPAAGQQTNSVRVCAEREAGRRAGICLRL